MRRWLVRRLLGERLWFRTLGCLNQCLDEWATTVLDPAMQHEPDDLMIVGEIRDDMKAIDKFWFPERLNDKIYQ